MACVYTLGSSSGRFRMDRVVAVMKYQVLRGRSGCLRMAASSAGVRMGAADAIMFEMSGSTFFDLQAQPLMMWRE